MRRIIMLFCLIVLVGFQCTPILTPDARPPCRHLYAAFDNCFAGTFGTGIDEQELELNLKWIDNPDDYCHLISGDIDIRHSDGTVTPWSAIGQELDLGEDTYQLVLTAYRIDETSGGEIRTAARLTVSSEGSHIQFSSAGRYGLPDELRVYQVDCEE